MLSLGPCLDDAARAEARKRELDIDPERAAQLGRSALEASQQGSYSDEQGNQVAWGEAIDAAIAAKRSIAPGDAVPASSAARFAETRVSVANETTLAAARQLIDSGLRPLALNFANGVQAGGGFLLGSRAQEEVLCRSSALFSTLLGDRMYDTNRRFAPNASSDWLILSPDVPVFRSDDGTSLSRPWLLSFATCAAPYAPALGQPKSGDMLQVRIERLFAVASAYGYDTLVLGAWGCGAFANHPARTARDFRAGLEACDGVFREVVFAIAD